jgi:hypothetical protein
MRASFGDDHARKGMADQNGRAVLPREHALGRSHRLGQGGQRVLHGRDVQSRCLQARNYFGPTGAVGEQPCTSTTLRACSAVAFAAMPRVEISEAAAPVSRAVEKMRLFIIMIFSLHRSRFAARAPAGRRAIFDWSSGRPLPIRRQPAVAAPLAHYVPEAREG